MAEDAPDRLNAGGMAFELGQATGAGPATVAVHDDRDVPGELRRERFLEPRPADRFERRLGSGLVGRWWRVRRTKERCSGH
jgi:hypothetical protein